MEMSEAEKSRELSQSAKHTFHNKEIEILTSEKIQKQGFHLRIWEKVEKKLEDNRKKGETEEERRNLKDMINDQTNKLTTEINDQTTKLTSSYS